MSLFILLSSQFLVSVQLGFLQHLSGRAGGAGGTVLLLLLEDFQADSAVVLAQDVAVLGLVKVGESIFASPELVPGFTEFHPSDVRVEAFVLALVIMLVGCQVVKSAWVLVVHKIANHAEALFIERFFHFLLAVLEMDRSWNVRPVERRPFGVGGSPVGETVMD